ncbi:Proteasome subunit beta type-6 [Scenedesmus sp. PABB004]|nr:Proteasome subunit beta type-6 [Scenedesmus sp. PABB004]
MADLNACGRRACAGDGGGAGAPGAGGAEPHTGTTIVACAYAGGVVLGADGRVSTGNYVSNRASNKIMQLTDSIFLLRSGSAADTQAVGDYVRFFSEQLAGELGEEPSVQTVANLVATMNYNNKNNLVGALLVAGYDEAAGGQVYGIPIGGTIVREAWAIDGSGSTYIWGYMDAAWKPDMTREEAEAFVVEALALAMARDASSGGVIRTVTLDKDGPTHRYIGGNDVPRFHEELPPPAPPASMAVG